MTAEERTDKSKFVNTAWGVDVGGQEWWVVIGFESTMKTVIRASSGKLALGAEIVRSGELYECLGRVNRALTLEDADAHSSGLS